MTRAMLLVTVLLCVIAFSGCVNVRPPDGPYVIVDEQKTVAPTKENVEFTRDFLDQARKDGVITRSQYDDLTKRLKTDKPEDD